MHALDLVNHPYDELAVGQRAELRRTCTANDLIVFAHASGNLNPRHLPGYSERETGQKPTAPAMWGASLFSALLGNALPGPGTAYLAQTLRFHGRVHPGDELVATVTVRAKREDRRVELDCRLALADGTLIADGIAEVQAPAVHITAEDMTLPELALRKRGKFERLLAACAGVPALRTAVIWPTDANALGGAHEAAKAGLIAPRLIGPAAAIRAAAEEIGWDLAGAELLDEPDEHAAPARAVALIHEGRAAALMKGNIHSDEVLRHVTKGDGGLRAGRRISHVFVLDVPGREGLMLISDAAINIAPDLMTKADIVQNAIDLARAIGIAKPRVGILSAVETVNPAIPSTLDAAILSKMADRGQIRGGVVDGPLAMDNAVDVEAARTKGIASVVAGHADVLIAPNLESGNMLAKQLVFLSQADTGGLVVGAKAPVMLTSRADDEHARLMSAALAVLHHHWARTGASLVHEPVPLAEAAQ
jgi:phosphate butyryltransferase